jgi:hypothetical protein
MRGPEVGAVSYYGYGVGRGVVYPLHLPAFVEVIRTASLKSRPLVQLGVAATHYHVPRVAKRFRQADAATDVKADSSNSGRGSAPALFQVAP